MSEPPGRSPDAGAADDEAIATLIAADAASSLDAAGLADLVARLGKAGRDREASAYAVRLLRARPGHRRALRALARAPVAGVDAAEGWRALATADPADAEPWLQLARIAAREKDAVGLLRACDGLLDRSPGHAEGLARRVAALAALGRPDEAARCWTELADVDRPRATDAVARAAAGTDLDARAALLGAAMAAGALTGDLLGEAESFLEALRAQARAAAADQNSAAEVAALWRITRLAPGDREAAAALAAAGERLRTELAQAGPNPPGRLAAAARALARAEPSRLPLVVLGRIAARSLAFGEAADALRRALAAPGAGADEDAALALELAEVSGRRGRMEEALEALEVARRAGDPWAARIAEVEASLRGLADAAQRTASEREDAVEAARLFDTLLALGADPARLAERAARLTRLIGRKMNEAAEARSPATAELARLYLARAGDDERAWLILGRALLRDRRDVEAVAVWERIAGRRPTDPEPALQIARLGKRLNRPELGGPAARRTLALCPGHAEALALAAHFDAGGGA